MKTEMNIPMDKGEKPSSMGSEYDAEAKVLLKALQSGNGARARQILKSWMDEPDEPDEDDYDDEM